MKDYKSIIKRPLITEKLTTQRETLNRYGFEVDKRANKHDIKNAVEQAYKVKGQLILVDTPTSPTTKNLQYWNGSAWVGVA